MDLKFLFPFGNVNRGSKIIIYGLGVCGKSYIEQIKATNYCEIVAVSDSYVVDNHLGCPFCKIKNLSKGLEFDYIVIGITLPYVMDEVCKELIANGIAKEKIISPLSIGNLSAPVHHEAQVPDENGLKVLYTMAGGLGDAIMELCLYEKLIEMVPDVVIDVYGEPCCKYVYNSKKNVRYIIDYNKESISLDQYDLALQASWGITIQKSDDEKIGRYSEELLRCIKETQYDMKRGESLITRLRRAQILGKDKFWLMGRGEIWSLSRNKIHLDIDQEYIKDFLDLDLKKYITVNCGVDMRRVRSDQIPTKIWPHKRFAEFIQLFKSKYKDIQVVQLGDDKQEKIIGADKYIFGKSFELVKHIIKNSLLHIDDEGGLVHMATALGTKCIVLFGPTPKEILGYPQNINLSTEVCPGCFAYVNDWNANCMKGERVPGCMWSIDPEVVYHKADEYLEM